MRLITNRLRALIFGVSIIAFSFVSPFLTSSIAYAGASCANAGGDCMASGICKADIADRTSISLLRKDCKPTELCCAPTDPKLRCTYAGGQYYGNLSFIDVNSNHNPLNWERITSIPLDGANGCYKLKPGCSDNDSSKNGPSCACAGAIESLGNGPRGGALYGLGCKSGLSCRVDQGSSVLIGGSFYTGTSQGIYYENQFYTPYVTSITRNAYNMGPYSARLYSGNTYRTINNVQSFTGKCTSLSNGSASTNYSNPSKNTQDYGYCNAPYASSKCQNISTSCAGGSYKSGYCTKYGSNIKCCVKNTTTTSRVSNLSNSGGNTRPEYNSSNSSCVKSYGGTCQWDDRSCSGGHYISGKCPGPAHYRCCVKNSPRFE